MPFQIDPYDPGAMLARMRPTPPNLDEYEQRALSLQNARNAASLFPIQKQTAELALKQHQFAQQDRELTLKERDEWQKTMAEYYPQYGEKAYEMARPKLATVLRPTTLAGIDKVFVDYKKEIAELEKKRVDTEKTLAELNDADLEALGGIAAHAAGQNYNPSIFDASLMMLSMNRPRSKKATDNLREMIAQNPDSTKELIESLITPKARAAATELAAKRAQTSSAAATEELTRAKIPGEIADAELKAAQAKAMTNMTDADWQTAIGNVVPDKNSALYKRTVAEVQFYKNKGDFKGAADAIKRAGEQLGQMEAAAIGQGITIRGQNLTDIRSRELAEEARQERAQTRADKPPTAAQTTVATYAARMENSGREFERIVQGLGERVWNTIMPNFAQTEKGQVFEQAERDFINATLRRESGAVINPSEFSEARKQYIPQPGDGPQVLKQKAANRKIVIESFKKAAGKAYESPEELLRSGGQGGGQIPRISTKQQFDALPSGSLYIDASDNKQYRKP